MLIPWHRHGIHPLFSFLFLNLTFKKREFFVNARPEYVPVHPEYNSADAEKHDTGSKRNLFLQFSCILPGEKSS
jgi:hypothetical protein